MLLLAAQMSSAAAFSIMDSKAASAKGFDEMELLFELMDADGSSGCHANINS